MGNVQFFMCRSLSRACARSLSIYLYITLSSLSVKQNLKHNIKKALIKKINIWPRHPYGLNVRFKCINFADVYLISHFLKTYILGDIFCQSAFRNWIVFYQTWKQWLIWTQGGTRVQLESGHEVIVFISINELKI